MAAAFKQLVQKWFPGGLWDTKHLARELLGIFEGRNHLGELHQQLIQPAENPSLMALLQVCIRTVAESLACKSACTMRQHDIFGFWFTQKIALTGCLVS